MRWPQRRSSNLTRRFVLVAICACAGYLAAWQVSAVRAEPFSSNSSSAGYGDEARAEELYIDGVEKLSAGHSAYARQTFESVIARYPSTDAAASARRQLSQLRGVPGTSNPDVIAATGDPAPVTGALSTPALSETPIVNDAAPNGPTWNRELRRNASIQSKLRIEAGDRVFFSPGSAELGSRARMALSAQAQWLMRWHEFEAAIEGHADEPGSEQENVVLSQQRAEVVRERLIAEGVEPSRLAVVPLGRSVRIATCSDTGCRAQNSRAVTLVFAGGTRERLGLVSPPALSISLSNPAPEPVGSPAATTTAQAVGVTR